MRNYNVARRQFRMYRDCTTIWLFCSIVGLIEVLFSAESPPFHGWSALAVSHTKQEGPGFPGSSLRIGPGNFQCHSERILLPKEKKRNAGPFSFSAREMVCNHFRTIFRNSFSGMGVPYSSSMCHPGCPVRNFSTSLTPQNPLSVRQLNCLAVEIPMISFSS